LKVTKKIYLFFLILATAFVIASASNSFVSIATQSELHEEQTAVVEEEPPVDLPYPLPQANPNPFENEAQNKQTPFRLEDSPGVNYEVNYNPETGEYEIQQMLDNEPIGAPFSMTAQEYFRFSGGERRADYWRTRAQESRGKSEGEGTSSGSSYLPNLDFDGDGESFFDENQLDIKFQGAAEVSFGFKYLNNQNPRFSRSQQRSVLFDFNNKIQMSLTGKVGDKVSLTLKYDTESQFEFDKEIKLQYEGDEDEIIKKIEVGNVSFPVANSLISGSQSLFGVASELQFGKLFVSSVFSRQQGEFSSINVQGGAQTDKFEVRSDNYDRNKHFFLGHYFREHYEEAFRTAPEITSGIVIRRVEIWTTQTSTGRENARNILALTNLGEEYTPTADGREYKLPTNGKLYNTIRNIPGIRNVNSISSALAGSYEQGRDYEKLEQAVLLNPNEYEINTKLGYISLRSAVNPSKIVALAYEYEYKGQVYQVGEFANESVAHPDVLIVKLVKSTQNTPSFANWDLMMKNVYAIGGYGISAQDFFLNILYEDDRTGTPIPYLPEGAIKGKNLLSVMNLDTISTDNLPYSDGIFDFLEGYTVNSSRGIIFFPVLEPFGSHLAEKIADPEIARKYVFQELYDSTQSAARQIAEKNKFLLSGTYKSSVRSEISLNATQVQKGSVTVTAGGRQLMEGVDFTVDYMGGTVRIINEGLLQSGSNIQINYESNPLFSMRTKNLLGTRLEYRYNPNINFGATFLRLSEKPMVQKVGFDDYPIVNNMWGLDAKYSTEAPILTHIVDKYVPFVSTKETSQIALTAEFAQLIPGQSHFITDAVAIDNFENTEGRIYLREPTSWRIASTPQGQPRTFPEGMLINDRAFNFNKALISWYNINMSFYNRNNSWESMRYSRPVYQTNLFPNRDVLTTENMPMTILNIAYYPYERGQNNYDTYGRAGISSGIERNTGNLRDPATRWGGIMQSLTTTDFEESNVEYIEFWLMNPFAEADDDREDIIDGNKGGDFYINLGRISEDILRDGRRSAENGLLPDRSRYDETTWGRVPNYSIVETGFSVDVAREIQDVGLDGLNDIDERNFFAAYLREIESIVTPEAYERFKNDPSGDNFSSYLDNRGEDIDIPWLYKYFSGTENNTPLATTQGVSNYRPDNEDANNDNTLQETEAYYQYHISLRPADLQVGQNFIVDKLEETVRPDGGGKTTVTTWYQFKIPIQTESKERIGDISDFRNIQNMRLFLRGFSDSVVLRIAEFALVYNSWRSYNSPIYEAGEYDIFNDSDLDISSVNIEENAQRQPVNYVLPPGVDRVIDPANTTIRELNESALQLTVVDLDDGNAKAVFKQFNKDFRQFGKLEMFIHAEALIGDMNLQDGDVCAFIRIGSDFTDNYYEYEVPLTLTEHRDGSMYNNNSVADRFAVWPEANKMSIEFDLFKNLKLERDKIISNGSIPNLQTFHTYSIYSDNNRVSIKGRPNLGNVRTIMIGVRNRKKNASNSYDDGQPKSVIVWFNEMGLTDMNDQSGWAANVSARMNFADFATLSLSGQTSKPGFGSIDQKVFERSQEEVYQYNIASNVSLHKFFPDAWNINLPFYIDFSEVYIRPQYDPTNPDILLKQALDNLESQHQRDSLLQMARSYSQNFNYNFTNVRIGKQPKKLRPWSLPNFSTSFAYSRFFAHDIDFERNYNHQYRVAFNYTYNLQPKNYQPFKNSSIKFFKDFNFFLFPNSYSFSNNWDRSYREQQRRNLSSYGSLPTTASKLFTWDRAYNVNYALSKNLKLTYSALNVSRINEPYGVINRDDTDEWSAYRRELVDELLGFGENTSFSQKWNLTYQVPLDKFKATNWITSNYRYTGSYDWLIGAELREDIDFGNSIKNTGTHTIDGTFNFTKLYTKSRYLNNVSKRVKAAQRTTSASAQPRTETVKFDKTGVKLQAGKPFRLKHKLKTEDVRLTVTDEKGKMVQGTTTVVSQDIVEFTPNTDATKAKISVSGRRKTEVTPFMQATDKVVNTLMMIKTANISYTQSEGTYIPGYKYGTQVFGFNNVLKVGNQAPMAPYVLGLVPSNLDNYLNTEHWIIDNDLLTDKYRYLYSTQWKTQITLEPVQNMRITLNSDRAYSHDHSRFIVGDYETNRRNAQMSGNFTMTYNALGSSFNSDKAYMRFRANRIAVANRLIREQVGNNYEINPDNGLPVLFKETSQDVLIPAFLAAYTRQNPEKVYTKNYFIPMFASVGDFLRTLNWRASYNGLARLKLFKPYFKSINLNHAYTSTYNMSSYQNFSSDNMIDDNLFIDRVDGMIYLAPQYAVGAVSISERFNPLIGIDARLQNDITAKFEVRSNRNVSLSFQNTEISETGGYEYVFGLGYVFKNFKIKINTARGGNTYSNDLNIRVDISIRNDQTIRRNIVEDITRKISGNRVFSLKSYADYMINERFTVRIYLDHNINRPLTNGYKTSTMSGGVNLRFTLM
jgi:cell surface protein SprA